MAFVLLSCIFSLKQQSAHRWTISSFCVLQRSSPASPALVLPCPQRGGDGGGGGGESAACRAAPSRQTCSTTTPSRSAASGAIKVNRAGVLRGVLVQGGRRFEWVFILASCFSTLKSCVSVQGGRRFEWVFMLASYLQSPNYYVKLAKGNAGVAAGRQRRQWKWCAGVVVFR